MNWVIYVKLLNERQKQKYYGETDEQDENNKNRNITPYTKTANKETWEQEQGTNNSIPTNKSNQGKWNETERAEQEERKIQEIRKIDMDRQLEEQKLKEQNEEQMYKDDTQQA